MRPLTPADRDVLGGRGETEQAARQFTVEHLHRFARKCPGTLTVSKTSVDFKAGEGDHKFRWPAPTIKFNFEPDGRVEVVASKGGDKLQEFKFTDSKQEQVLKQWWESLRK